MPEPRAGTNGAPTSARLFVALWPGPRTRQALAAWRDACIWPAGARPVPDAKLHLTLHFIGSVPASRVDAVARGLAVPARPAALTLTRAAVWPRGLVVLEPQSPTDPLRGLHADLAAALGALGLPVERRRFRPHVTLAREASGAQVPASHAPIVWRTNAHALVQSLPDGRYRVLRRYAAL
jgi:2'-5' RNA ligase